MEIWQFLGVFSGGDLSLVPCFSDDFLFLALLKTLLGIVYFICPRFLKQIRVGDRLGVLLELAPLGIWLGVCLLKPQVWLNRRTSRGPPLVCRDLHVFNPPLNEKKNGGQSGKRTGAGWLLSLRSLLKGVNTFVFRGFLI